MSEKKADLFLFLTAALWGMSIIFTNIAYSENIKTFQMMFFRFFPSAIIIFIVFGKSMFPINKTAVINGLLLGIINFASYAFELLAVSKSQPSKVAFLLSVTVVAVPLINWVIKKKTPHMHTIIAAFITMAGVGFMSLKSNFTINIGDSFAIISGLCVAVNAIMLSYLKKDCPIMQMTFFQFIAIAILSFGGYIIEGSHSAINIVGGAAIAYNAVVSSVVCFALKNIAMPHTSPAKGSIILSTESIFCTIFSVLVLNEHITLRIIIGAVLIFAAVFMEEGLPKGETEN